SQNRGFACVPAAITAQLCPLTARSTDPPVNPSTSVSTVTCFSSSVPFTAPCHCGPAKCVSVPVACSTDVAPVSNSSPFSSTASRPSSAAKCSLDCASSCASARVRRSFTPSAIP